MSTASNDPQEVRFVAAFTEALAKSGWSRGRNVEIETRWGAGDANRMAANARELVAAAPDVILTKGANLPAVENMTSNIPIVFVVLSDAVAEKMVGSFARPKGNVTGFTSYERALVGKRLQLLHELSPDLKRVLYIRSRRTGADTAGLLTPLKENATLLGVTVIDGAADDDADIERAFRSFRREHDCGVIVAFDAFTVVHQAKILQLAASDRLPTIYPLRVFMRGGGLMSYGLDQEDQFRQAATYVARILAGDKPGDLPVQAPTKFELAINLKTAKALGLTVPQSLLLSADEVIE
jgi:putative ABC transport system substrate-binding protein